MNELLSVQNLSGGYGGDDVVRNVSFNTARGDFLGILGPNGSGKSTLLKLMSRVLRPREGRVLLEGSDIARLPLKGFCRRVAFVPPETPPAFSFSVWETVLMGRTPHLGRLEHETKKDFDCVARAMSFTGLEALRDKRTDELSAGERQRAVIARALAQEPALLLLDEPTSHLDVGHQIQILDLMRTLNRRDGLTVVTVLHDLNLASDYCDRVLLLDGGRLFRQGPPRDVLTYQNIESLYKTVVVVNESPVTRQPHVTLVPGHRP
jgi:iron complex transport system ATP-binding protein